MSASVKFYTLGLMGEAKIITVTSEATGYSANNLMDFNPDTYWKATSTADQTIDIDLGAAQYVDNFGIWMHNHTTVVGDPLVLTLKYDANDNGSYSSTTTLMSGSTTDLGPIIMPDTTPSSATKRYWRLVISGLSATPEVSCVYLCRTRSLAIGNELPENDIISYVNKTIIAPGGRKLVRVLNSASVRTFQRTYLIPDSANMETLTAAFQECQGSAYPLIMVEDSGTEYYVYFDQDELDQNKIGNTIWKPTVQFRQIPYVAPGHYY